MAGLVLSAEGGTYLHGLLVYKRLWHRMASKWQVPKAGMRVLMLVGWMASTKMSLHCISFVTVDTCHSCAILISTVAHKALTEKSLFSPHSGKKLTQGHRVLWRLQGHTRAGSPSLCLHLCSFCWTHLFPEATAGQSGHTCRGADPLPSKAHDGIVPPSYLPWDVSLGFMGVSHISLVSILDLWVSFIQMLWHGSSGVFGSSGLHF